MRRASAVGPERLLTNVGSPPPFALSLSKGQAELVEAFVPRAKGFDRLSPNGSLQTVNFAFGPKADRTRERSELGGFIPASRVG
jgi:hypothetical protein